eukprot:CAMPEP_0198591204 /NCGR_PEP_ID=MMETSP1462-20131121/136609_1 /TAXON_ID=1333877 /ORGANISM="Brandtodinium nutriculum, Strain RCC3387" /LENGTH=39 /DNA_ID= /DNA_START= /DNA_END= /DNA_ORIENTATION=
MAGRAHRVPHPAQNKSNEQGQVQPCECEPAATPIAQLPR